MPDKITEAEAKAMIKALKRLISSQEISFPAPGSFTEEIAEELFDSSTKFIISIAPGAYDINKCTYQARIKANNIVLMRLDLVSNDKAHKNPDGTIIYGPHLHVYSEKYGTRAAVKFEVESEDLIDNCLAFMHKIGVIEPDPIKINRTLFS